MVSVELAPAVIEVGANVAVAPPGKPDAVSATDCADPDVTVVLIVLVVKEP